MGALEHWGQMDLWTLSQMMMMCWVNLDHRCCPAVQLVVQSAVQIAAAAAAADLIGVDADLLEAAAVAFAVQLRAADYEVAEQLLVPSDLEAAVQLMGATAVMQLTVAAVQAGEMQLAVAVHVFC